MFQYFSNQNNFDFGSFNLLYGSTASGHPAGLDLTAEMPIVEFCVCASCCGPQKELVVDTGSWSGPNIDGGASPFSGILPDGETDIFFTTIPDDSSTAAVLPMLPIGGNVSESLEAIGDRDWFRVDLVAGTSYIFTMDGSGMSPLDDPLLYLRDSDGSVLDLDDDGGPDLNSEIRYTAATSGTFFISAQSYNDNHDGDYRLTASAYTPVPLPMRTPQEIAEYLMNRDNEGVGPVWGSTNISFNIESISAGAQNLAQLAFDAWASVSGLTFTQTTGGADITFQDTNNNAYARTFTTGNTITGSIINISSGWEGGNTDFDSYTYQTYVHEIGHALGLSHGGPYEGSASWSQDDMGDNIYQNDSWAYTVMSYFDQNEAGGFGSIRYVLGPQISDIIAISTMYGANTTTRNGDTVYGFNSTETDVHDFTQFTAPPSLSIFDTGGYDSLDFSGYTPDQTISLVQETFSSVGGYTNVISIASGTVIENAFGGSGNDVITGNDQTNGLSGNAGNDTLNGGDGLDLLYGGDDDDILNGDDGDDYMYGSVGADRFDGGDGNDRVIYKYSPGSVIVHLGTGGTGGEAEGDTFVNVERIYGSEFDDQITGTTANEFLLGLKGNDTLNGGGGIDRLFGGDGDDIITGGADEDHLLGQNDNDTLYGGDSRDLLYGGAGNDTLNGDDGDDYMYGSVDADRFDGGDGNDRVIYKYSPGGVIVHLGTGGTGGEAEGDTFVNVERIYGSEFDDQITGTTANEFLLGLKGNDTLNGGGGIDRLFGGDDDDYLNGGAGDDRLYGGIGGADIYAFDAAHGTDYVFQFDQGSDKIRFEAGSGVTSFSDLTITQSGIHVDIVTSAGTIKASYQTASDFTADDFEFVTAAAAEIADKTDGASMHAFAEDLTSKDQFAGLENLEGVTDEPSHGNMNARGEELELALAGQNATYENLSATTNTNPAQPDFVQLASELAADQGFDLEHWGREDHFIDSWLL